MSLFKKSLACFLTASLLITVTPSIPPVSAEAARKIYIAPYSGKKYHCSKNCRGLRRARSIKKVTITYAKKNGYTKCGICY